MITQNVLPQCGDPCITSYKRKAQLPSSTRCVSVSKGLGSAYGAYIGEVIRRSEPGAKWEPDDSVGGEKSYPIIGGPGHGHSYPMARCYHRIVNGPEDNVWVKFRVLKDRTMKTLLPKAK
jgi:hypothetical protein